MTNKTSSTQARRDAAVIGPSIQIDGDVRGDEDLVIEGEVNGTVHLVNNSVTVGNQGKIRANVHAHSVYVDGIVEGDLYGSERVCIRKSAMVKGNITSPRVSLDDGARFKGSIEMDHEVMEAKPTTAQKATAKAPAPEAHAGGNGQNRPAKNGAAEAAAKGGPAAG